MPMKLPSKKTVFGLALLIGLPGIFGWFQVRPIPVTVSLVGRAVVVAEVMGTGTLEARVSTTVGSKVSGRIEKILADQGDRVKAGQVLLRLDDVELRRQVDVARADQAAAAAAVTRQQADKLKAEVVLKAARREQLRLIDLVKKKLVSSAEADKAQDAVRFAEAGLGAAQAAVLEAERRKIASARGLEYQQARLAETVIRAPFAGLITRRHREPGDVMVSGSPVLSLIATDELWISAWVDETEMARLVVGQGARVLFRSEPKHAFGGSVARLGREVDRETREFIAEVKVSQRPKNWAVGQRAEVFIEVQRSKETISLPARLIRRKGADSGVFVLEDGRARWRKVELGIRGRGAVEVSSGLQPGEKVLERRDGRPLRDGRRVLLP